MLFSYHTFIKLFGWLSCVLHFLARILAAEVMCMKVCLQLPVGYSTGVRCSHRRKMNMLARRSFSQHCSVLAVVLNISELLEDCMAPVCSWSTLCLQGVQCWRLRSTASVSKGFHKQCSKQHKFLNKWSKIPTLPWTIVAAGSGVLLGL